MRPHVECSIGLLQYVFLTGAARSICAFGRFQAHRSRRRALAVGLQACRDIPSVLPWGTRCAATCNVLLRGPRCAQHMCVALRIRVCFGALSCCREGPGVWRHVGVMSCRTRNCVTKSGRNIFSLQEYCSNALCTYCILCMLLWRQIFCRIYVDYLPSSRILYSAWYDNKLLVNSEYRGSRYWFIKSLHCSESKCGEWCLRSSVESASVVRGILMWLVSWS